MVANRGEKGKTKKGTPGRKSRLRLRDLLNIAFHLDLRDAELLRKLIIEQREHPEQIPQIPAREFLRALYEGNQRVPRLLPVLAGR